MSHITLLTKIVPAFGFSFYHPRATQRPDLSQDRSKADNSRRELVVQQAPDLISGLFLDVNEAVNKLGSVLNKATNSLGCPKLNNISKSAFDDYPGLTKE